MNTHNPKIQWRRKLGHLWQVLYGLTPGRGCYGYGITAKQAANNARASYSKGAWKSL